MDEKKTNELTANIESNEKLNLNSNVSPNDDSINSLSMGLTRLNVDAPVFVPSFAFNQDINTTNNKDSNIDQINETQINQINSNDNNKTPTDEKTSDEVVDDWEANADEEDDDEEEDGISETNNSFQ